MAPHRLVVLCGGPDVCTDGARLRLPAPTRRQATLAMAYLLLAHGRPVPADELADACWPTGPPSSWPAGLRKVLSDVRTWLAEGGIDAEIRSTHGTYEIVLPTAARLDVEAARAHLQRARRGGDRPEADDEADSARAAVDHLLQPLLPAHEAPWLQQVRRDLERELLEGLDLLADAERRCGNTDAALAAAERAIGLDPLRESSHRLAMAAHRTAGRIGAALRQYEDCRRVLADEVGTAPSPATTAAYHVLLDLQIERQPAPSELPDAANVETGLGAAVASMQRLERGQAVAALEARLATIDAMPSPDPLRRVETLVELGRARWMLEGSTEALRRISLAAGEAALGLREPHAFCDALSLASTTTGIGQVDPDAEDLCARGLAVFPDDLRVRVQVRGLQAELCFGDRSIELAQNAVALARELGDPRVLLDLLLVLDQSLAWTPDLARRLQVEAECDELLLDLPEHWRQRPTFEEMTRLQAGDPDWFAQPAGRHPEWRESLAWELRVHVGAMRAVEAKLAGDLERAHRGATEMLQSSAGELNTMHAAGGLLLALSREMGGIEDLLPSIDAIVASNPRIPAFRAARAAARAVVGEDVAAAELLDELAGAGFGSVEHEHVHLLYLGLLAEAAALLEAEGHAIAILRLLEPYAGQMCVGAHGIVVLNAMDTYRGMLAVVTGDPDGPKWFEQGMELEGRLGADLLRARSAGWYAAHLRRHGGPEHRARAAELAIGAQAVADAAPDRSGLAAMLARLSAIG